MGRLKKDHHGWHTHGLWLKYQSPKADEQPIKAKSKKNTNKWCKGKVGKEHEWHSYQQKRWNDEKWQFMWSYTEIHCVVCGKEKYLKTGKARNYPFHLFINEESSGYEPVQVRVNGKYLPLKYFEYLKDGYYCRPCGVWH